MKKLKIAHQLFLLMFGTVVAFGGVTFFLIRSSADAIYEERFDLLRTQVESAFSVMDYYYKKEQWGELSHEAAQAQAYAVLSQVRYEPAGYLVGLDYDVIQRFHPSPVNIGKDLSGLVDKTGLHFSSDLVVKGRAGGGRTIYHWSKLGQPQDQFFPKGAYSKAFEPWKIVISAGFYLDDLNAAIAKTVWKMAGLGSLVALLAAIVATVIVRNITRPLQAVHVALQAVASDDVDIEVPHSDMPNEVGAMARATQALQEKVRERLSLEARETHQRRELEHERQSNLESQQRESAAQAHAVAAISETLNALANGDLTPRCQDLGSGYESLRSNFNGAFVQLETAMSNVNAKCRNISGSKEEIRRASSELSQRTERQAVNLEETSAALDQLVVAIRHTAEGARVAAQRVDSVSADASHSDHVVKQAIDAMGGIERSAAEISKIIGVIDEIAFQTNLLALNAGVEAARAGDSGKGFAVVAQEVRELAQRSAAAAKEIKGQISHSSVQVNNGVLLVVEAGEALKRISVQVKTASDIVGKIAHSAAEQNTTLTSIASSLNQLDAVTQTNAAMAEETTASTEALACETDELMLLVSAFRIGNADAKTMDHRNTAQTLHRAA